MLFVLNFLTLTTSVSTLGSAIVLNNSTSTMYAWSVGGSIGDRQTVVSGSYAACPPNSLLTVRGGLYNGEPQQVFSYNLDGDVVYYDLSSVFGAPFAGNRIEVTSTNGGPIVWSSGTNPG